MSFFSFLVLAFLFTLCHQVNHNKIQYSYAININDVKLKSLSITLKLRLILCSSKINGMQKLMKSSKIPNKKVKQGEGNLSLWTSQ